jgi:hypothetical protein
MEIPVELNELKRRLEDWRSRQSGRRRLPDELWSEAAKLGQRHGFTRVARLLRMNVAVLRGKSRHAQRRPGRAGPAAFVELALPLPAGECTLELDTRRGKLRLELRRMPVAAIAELVRALAA